MAGTQSIEIHPQAFLASENGDLVKVTDFTITTDNKGKLLHSQRRASVGVTKGKPETEVTFKSLVGEDGMEHNYFKLVQRGTIKQLRAKLPGGQTIALNGMYTRCALTGPLEDAVTVDVRFVAKMDDQ